MFGNMGGFIKNFPRFRIILQYLNPNLKNPIGRKEKRISLEILAINHDHHPSTIKCSSNHRINNKNQTRQQNTLANLPTKTKTTLNPQVFPRKNLSFALHFTVKSRGKKFRPHCTANGSEQARGWGTMCATPACSHDRHTTTV